MNINNIIKKNLLKDNQHVRLVDSNSKNIIISDNKEELYRKYEDLFKHLHMNKKCGYVAPHKPVLLLSIMKLIADGKIKNEVIIFDHQVKNEFLTTWELYVNESTQFSPSAKTPFIHLESEPFWNTVDSRTAIIDKDLYTLMNDDVYRTKMQKLLIGLINNGLNRNDRHSSCIQDAINEYEGVIHSFVSERTTSEINANNELVENFSKLNEDIQYALNIEYFTFLKKNINEREMFKVLCPTVYDLYDKIAFHPIKSGEISPSISFTYENFLADLKIALMNEANSFELVDMISEAIKCLSSLESNQQEYLFEEEEKVKEVSSITEPIVSTPAQNELRPLSPALESRKGKPWTSKEEEQITLYYKQGYAFDAIANAMGRTEVSIKARLATLGLIEYSYENDTSPLRHPQ